MIKSIRAYDYYTRFVHHSVSLGDRSDCLYLSLINRITNCDNNYQIEHLKSVVIYYEITTI